jgi:hypothetical protein
MIQFFKKLFSLKPTGITHDYTCKSQKFLNILGKSGTTLIVNDDESIVYSGFGSVKVGDYVLVGDYITSKRYIIGRRLEYFERPIGQWSATLYPAPKKPLSMNDNGSN